MASSSRETAFELLSREALSLAYRKVSSKAVAAALASMESGGSASAAPSDSKKPKETNTKAKVGIAVKSMCSSAEPRLRPASARYTIADKAKKPVAPMLKDRRKA